MPLCGLRDSPLKMRRSRMNCCAARAPAAASAATPAAVPLQWLNACSMRDFLAIDAFQIRGRQIDLARRHLERLAGVVLVADREIRSPACRWCSCTITCRSPERRRQRDADHRHPTRTVLNHQCAMPVGVDIGHGRRRWTSRRRILTPPGTGILVRQVDAQGGRAARRAARSARRWTRMRRESRASRRPSTLARILPAARRASMIVPGLASAALRRMSPPSRLTMA